MKEILWLGRGGQGAFTAAKLFGAAYITDRGGQYALSFPSFGPERRGAPVRAFTKLDTKPVLDRSQTEHADFIVVLDDTLYSPALRNLLKPEGSILVNSRSQIEGAEVYDAAAIAKELRLPTVNTVMLGIAAARSGLITAEQAVSAIRGYMPEKLHARNIEALERAGKAVQK
ncbi:MAG: 2-oxoacid:acceptor oxidoreductase family protein [Oscillospiraceae bacterium]|nr:2-oxoacid:acceptor oxidoreductase family protein [Oscillospiraceae bacterium]